MFTGLIEEVGAVVAARTYDHGTELQIAAPRIAKQVKTGESIAVNGCCLTITSSLGTELDSIDAKSSVRTGIERKYQE